MNFHDESAGSSISPEGTWGASGQTSSRPSSDGPEACRVAAAARTFARAQHRSWTQRQREGRKARVAGLSVNATLAFERHAQQLSVGFARLFP